MNITNLELTQATLEIFGGLVCILTYIIIVINDHMEKRMQIFKQMFLITTILFFSEALAYIFRGNIDPISIVITRATNFIVFFINFLLTSIFIRYVYSLLKEKDVSLNPIYKKIVDSCTILAILILFMNIPTKWMYYFDAQNYYHRNFGWYFYTLLSLNLPVICVMITWKHKREISKITFYSLILYVLAPFIAIILQSLYYGISIISIGIALSTFGLLFTYVYEWNLQHANEFQFKETSRKSHQINLLFATMVLIMSVSIVSCVFSMNNILKKNTEKDYQTISYMVADRIDNEIVKASTVTQTISSDYNLKALLKNKDSKEASKNIISYLKSIQEGFGYPMVYIVNDRTKEYYTSEHLVKIIDVDNDPTDLWYKEFLSMNKHTDLNVDTDSSNQWKLSVFINTQILDSDGTLLGVCGVGIQMSDLQELLSKYESKYDTSIHLVDSSGLVQFSTDSSEILSRKMKLSHLSNSDAEDFLNKEENGISIISKYMENLDWYLVIEFTPADAITLVEVTLPSVVIFLLGLIMMGIVANIINVREKKSYLKILEKSKASLTDDMTGLANRRAYDIDMEKLKGQPLEKNLVLIGFDINGLKHTNDTLGHLAGDELIIGLANCFNTTILQYGKIYRVGGDEFVAILSCTKDQLDDCLQTFDHLISTWKGNLVSSLSVSKGVVLCHEEKNLTLLEMIQLADRRMYEDKKEYYSRKENDRRKR